MRVSNATLQQSMMLELQRAQNSFTDAQQRVSSGKIGNDLKAFGSKAELASAGHLAKARAEQRIDLAKQMEMRFETQELALTRAEDGANGLKQELLDALGANSGIGLGSALATAFAQAKGAFNTEMNGNYVFGGTRTDTLPINIETLDDLGGAPSVAYIFSNNTIKPTADFGEGPAEIGQLASDVATPLFQVIKNIKDYINVNGDFGAPLTTAQQDFLKSQLPLVDAAATTLVQAEGVNGNQAKYSDTQRGQQDDLRVALTKFVSNVEDADIVEASVQVQQSQLAYEAAAQTLAKLNSLSLLDFLR